MLLIYGGLLGSINPYKVAILQSSLQHGPGTIQIIQQLCSGKMYCIRSHWNPQVYFMELPRFLHDKALKWCQLKAKRMYLSEDHNFNPSAFCASPSSQNFGVDFRCAIQRDLSQMDTDNFAHHSLDCGFRQDFGERKEDVGFWAKKCRVEAKGTRKWESCPRWAHWRWRGGNFAWWVISREAS